jgi:hypothetical protein
MHSIAVIKLLLSSLCAQNRQEQIARSAKRFLRAAEVGGRTSKVE